NTGETPVASSTRLLTTIAYQLEGRRTYALEGAIFIAGAAVQWLRDGLQLVDSAADSEALARSVESTGGVYFVPALVGLGAPHWAPDARGTIVGITRGTSRAHLVRAALEAMAYGTADVVATVREQGVALDRLRVDGGATANDWLMQFQADVLQVTVERPAMIETTALGAAGLAGIASGVWLSPDEFLASRDFARFSPRRDAGAMAAEYDGWRRAVRATLAWAADTP
ncbi:MAG: FGGY family carbohydrate kinase, partial [Gemmatimonadota bacterium]